MLRSVVVVLGVTALACAGKPTSGDYLFENGEVTTDCPTSEDTGGGSEDNDPIGVRISDDGDSVTLRGTECPLDGRTFTCETSDVTDYSDMEVDVVVTYSTNLTGTWSTGTEIEGTSGFQLDCEGADCDTVGITPCSGSWDFTATLVEDE